ncbi:MAG: hypothetical protein ACOYMN_08140 [Roseimicrobium sp.]
MSPSQLQQLGIAATEAFAVMERHDLLELPREVMTESRTKRLDFWRRRQCAIITGKCSFRELTARQGRDEYRMVLLHFQTLSGNKAAMRTAEREVAQAACHVSPGCEYVRQMHAALTEAKLQTGYLYAILENRFKAARLEDLSEAQLRELLYTVRNRCRAKLGVGNAADRNKRQRGDRQERQRQAQAQAETQAEPPQTARTYVLNPAKKFVPTATADPF